MWLMGKSQSLSRNVSLRYLIQVLSHCIKKVSIALCSFSAIYVQVPCLNIRKVLHLVTYTDVSCSLVCTCKSSPSCFA